MELGGSSINAVDLALALRRLGHETTLIARPGPLADRVRDVGLPLFVTNAPARPRPSPGTIRDIRTAVRRHKIDLVHTYEFWPCVEAYFAVGLNRGVRVVSTIMTMGLATYLPRAVPMTVGYGDLMDEARLRQRAPVHLLEPPVDTASDQCGNDTDAFRREFDLPEGPMTVVLVSRVAVAMKQEGIERTVAAVGRLARRHDVRLVVVGGGSAYADVAALADEVNASVGRRVVVMTGPLADPRPAYEIADVVVGMGSSILRGMAFGKPGIVVGEMGFSMLVTEESVSRFERTGFYGVGVGRPSADSDPLVDQLGGVLADGRARRRLGDFGHSLVESRYALSVAAHKVDAVYRLAVTDPAPTRVRLPDLAMTFSRVVAHKARDGGVVDRWRRPVCS
jgi:glycosyltransferase involved in cell wall biosynthesis